MLTHTFETNQKPKRVVILGANGFVGKKLAAALQEQGIQTKLITRQDVDLAQEEASSQLESYLQPQDSIVFLSAITPDKGKDTNTFIKNCKIGQAVQASLQKIRPSHIVYFSSDAVYPMTSEIVSETSVPAPEDLYGLMHRARELMMQSVGVPMAIVRPTIIFGAGDTHNSYGPNKFIREAFEKGTITLFGGGEEMRSHVYIEDIISATLDILGKKSFGIINLATNQSVSFYSVAESVKNKFDKSIEIIKKDRASPITHRHFDISQLYKSFPSLQFRSFEEALEMSIVRMDSKNAAD